MAGLVPAIHAFTVLPLMDARHKVYTWARRRRDPGARPDEWMKQNESQSQRYRHQLPNRRPRARALAYFFEFARDFARHVGRAGDGVEGSLSRTALRSARPWWH